MHLEQNFPKIWRKLNEISKSSRPSFWRIIRQFTFAHFEGRLIGQILSIQNFQLKLSNPPGAMIGKFDSTFFENAPSSKIVMFKK